MTDHRIGPETNRLLHRQFCDEDAEVYFALRSHPDVIRYTGDTPLESIDEARTAIAEYPDFDTVGYGRWACVLKETQQVIGFSGLKYLPEMNETDVGYRFLPEFWGQGLATESALASVAYGFQTLGLERIIGLVLAENAASIHVLEKAGLRPDGVVDCEGLEALRYLITIP